MVLGLTKSRILKALKNEIEQSVKKSKGQNLNTIGVRDYSFFQNLVVKLLSTFII